MGEFFPAIVMEEIQDEMALEEILVDEMKNVRRRRPVRRPPPFRRHLPLAIPRRHPETGRSARVRFHADKGTFAAGYYIIFSLKEIRDAGMLKGLPKIMKTASSFVLLGALLLLIIAHFYILRHFPRTARALDRIGISLALYIYSIDMVPFVTSTSDMCVLSLVFVGMLILYGFVHKRHFMEFLEQETEEEKEGR